MPDASWLARSSQYKMRAGYLPALSRMSAGGYTRTQSPHRNDDRFHPQSRHSSPLCAFSASNFKLRHFPAGRRRSAGRALPRRLSRGLKALRKSRGSGEPWPRWGRVSPLSGCNPTRRSRFHWKRSTQPPSLDAALQKEWCAAKNLLTSLYLVVIRHPDIALQQKPGVGRSEIVAQGSKMKESGDE